MTSSEYVVPAPKMAQYKDKYGKFYASKEKLWVLIGTFLVPKASPLHVCILIL